MALSPLSLTVPSFSFTQAKPYIQAVQHKRPLVHCLTNTVVQNFTANVLLATGASPAMVEAEEEVAEFVPAADSLLVNLGTVNALSARAMLLAAKVAQQSQTPWVLDPVAVGQVLAFRSTLAQQLLTYQPTVIRGNASEILALANRPSQAKGPDSLDGLDEAIDAAEYLAVHLNTIIAVTGQVDYVTDGCKRYIVEGGNRALTRVTGTGCALSALVAAFIASHSNRLDAAASACLLVASAAEQAALSQGIGSFAVSLLDNLSFIAATDSQYEVKNG